MSDTRCPRCGYDITFTRTEAGQPSRTHCWRCGYELSGRTHPSRPHIEPVDSASKQTRTELAKTRR